MTLTVRLNMEEEHLLNEAARQLGRSRSDVVREAIALYAQERLARPGESAAKRLERWIGCHDSGGRGLSERSGAVMRRFLEKKRGSRPR